MHTKLSSINHIGTLIAIGLAGFVFPSPVAQTYAQVPNPCQSDCFGDNPNYSYPSDAEQEECLQFGQRDARHDVAQDSLVEKFWGLPQPWHEVYARFMRERYEVHVDFVAADLVCERETSYWSGYNSISVREMERRFGQAIDDSTFAEAQRWWYDRMPGMKPLNRDSVLVGERLRRIAKEADAEGRVVVRFVITGKGGVTEAEVHPSFSLGSKLDSAAVHLVRELRFEPAELPAEAIKPRVSYPVDFKVND